MALRADLQFGLWRETLLLAVLFSMYCFTTELERLGKALLENDASGRNLPEHASPNPIDV